MKKKSWKLLFISIVVFLIIWSFLLINTEENLSTPEMHQEELNVISSDSQQAYNLIKKNYIKDGKVDGHALTNLIRAAIDLEKNEEVVKYWNLIIENSIKDINYNDVVWDICLAHINLWDYKKAEELIHKYINQIPKLHYHQWIIYRKESKFSKAINEFMEITDINEEFYIDSLYLKAKSYKNSWDISQAIWTYEILEKFDKGDKTAIYSYLWFLDLKQIYEELWNDDQVKKYELKFKEIKKSIDNWDFLTEEWSSIDKASQYRWINYVSNM